MLGSLIGPYRIVRLLGEGGMASVYEAVNESMERRVAIKVLHPAVAGRTELVDRFLNEARAVNRVAHPSIVQIQEQGRLPDGTPFVVMEYLDGETLGQRLLGAGGRLPLLSAIEIVWQVAAALAAAHAKGIVHRDLNPRNLMLVPDPLGPGGERVKVLDFGIAKLVAEVEKDSGAALAMGTPTYMSPEQWDQAGAVDAKTDVYALGVILFELCAGRPPFIDNGADSLMGMHLFQAPPLLDAFCEDAPEELVAFVARLLRKARDERPKMAEVADQLGELGSVIGGVTLVGLTRRLTSANPQVASQQHQALSAKSPLGYWSGATPIPAATLPPPPPVRARPAFSWQRSGLSALAGGALMAMVVALSLRALPPRPTAEKPAAGGTDRPLPPIPAADLGPPAGELAVARPTPSSLVLAPHLPPLITAEAVAIPVARPAVASSGKPVALPAVGPAPSPVVTPPPHPPAVVPPPVSAARPVVVPPPVVVSPVGPPPVALPGGLRPMPTGGLRPMPVAKPVASSTNADRVLSDAQRENLQHNYAQALKLARSVEQESPLRAWRTIGAAACGLKDRGLVKEAYLKLDLPGRQYLAIVCERSGINTDALVSEPKK